MILVRSQSDYKYRIKKKVLNSDYYTGDKIFGRNVFCISDKH